MKKLNEENVEKRTGIAANIATVVATVAAIIALFISGAASYQIDKMKVLVNNSESIIDSLSVQISELKLKVNELNINQQTNINSPNSVNGNNNYITNNITDLTQYSIETLLKLANYDMQNYDLENASRIYMLEKLDKNSIALNALGIIHAVDDKLYDLKVSLKCFSLALCYCSDDNQLQSIQNNLLLALNKNPDYYEELRKNAQIFCGNGNYFACSILESAYTHEKKVIEEKVDISKYDNLKQDDFYSWEYLGAQEFDVMQSPKSYGESIHYPSEYIKLEVAFTEEYPNPALGIINTTYIYKIYQYNNIYLKDKIFVHLLSD